MRGRLALIVVFAAVAGLGLATAWLFPAAGSAHQHGCHAAHSCPSDHATYVWYDSNGAGWLCVSPGADEYDPSFSTTIVYDGLTYYCKPAGSTTTTATTATTTTSISTSTITDTTVQTTTSSGTSTGSATTTVPPPTAIVVSVPPMTGPPSVVPRLWKNCANVNRRYPHGVGKVGARDKTRRGRPVTNFKRSNKLYRTAMHYNRGLDRDRDGIACEKG